MGSQDELKDLETLLSNKLGSQRTYREKRMFDKQFMEDLHQTLEAAGEEGPTAEQRAVLYEMLLAVVQHNGPALKRLLVLQTDDDKAVLAGYRKLDEKGQALVHRTIKGINEPSGRFRDGVYFAPVLNQQAAIITHSTNFIRLPNPKKDGDGKDSDGKDSDGT